MTKSPSPSPSFKRMNKTFVFSISNCFDSNFQLNHYQDLFLSLKNAAPAAQDCFSLIMQGVK